MDAEMLYRQREKRVQDAVALREPDRVPLCPVIGAYPLKRSGLTIREVMEDITVSEQPMDGFFAEFQADLVWNPANAYYPSKLLELLGVDMFRWPGHGIDDPELGYQYVENEYMLEDEYAEFIADPTCFMQRKWIPRVFDNLAGLRHMNLRNSLWLGFFGTFAQFGNGELKSALRTLMDAAELLEEWSGFLSCYNEKLERQYGFPLANIGAFAPFDMLGDTLRGTIPILMDMADKPDELKEAMERMLMIGSEATLQAVEQTGQNYVWFWMHKGTDEMMSGENYREFYWKPLRRYLELLIARGVTPILHCQGNYDTRLEILAEMTPGKVVYNFESVDMARAKTVLKNTACIMGNVPVALLEYGSAQDVVDYCKQLIDDCAPGGGFILDASAIIEDAKPENLRAMYDTAFTYGKYR